MEEGLGRADDRLGGPVVAPADIMGALDCTVAVSDSIVVGAPDYTTAVVPGGTVEEQARAGVARDQPAVAKAQPAVVEEGWVTPFSPLGLGGQ